MVDCTPTKLKEGTRKRLIRKIVIVESARACWLLVRSLFCPQRLWVHAEERLGIAKKGEWIPGTRSRVGDLFLPPESAAKEIGSSLTPARDLSKAGVRREVRVISLLAAMTRLAMLGIRVAGKSVDESREYARVGF